MTELYKEHLTETLSSLKRDLRSELSKYTLNGPRVEELRTSIAKVTEERRLMTGRSAEKLIPWDFKQKHK